MTVFAEQPLAFTCLLKTSNSFDSAINLQIPAAAAHQRGGAPSIVSPSKVTLPACSTLAEHLDKKCFSEICTATEQPVIIGGKYSRYGLPLLSSLTILSH